MQAVDEADEYVEDGSEPQSFVVDAFEEEDAPLPMADVHAPLQPSAPVHAPMPAAPPLSTHSLTPAARPQPVPLLSPAARGGALAQQPYPLLSPEEQLRDVRHQRRLATQRRLGLCAPLGSPAAVHALMNPNLAPLIQQAMYNAQMQG